MALVEHTKFNGDSKPIDFVKSKMDENILRFVCFKIDLS